MQKVLTAYILSPTVANAARVMAYVRKHPMAVCLLTVDEQSMVRRADLQAALAR